VPIRNQVSLKAPTNEKWAVCVLGSAAALIEAVVMTTNNTNSEAHYGVLSRINTSIELLNLYLSVYSSENFTQYLRD